jgi:hypothetical protein
VIALGLACAPPFDESRKDLASFRLLSLSASPGPRVAVWSGLGPWHEVAPAVAWSDTDDGGVTVTVTDVDGAHETGVLGAVGPPPAVLAVTRDVVADTATLSIELEDPASYTRWSVTEGTLVETGPSTAELTWDGVGLVTVFALHLTPGRSPTWTWLDVAFGDVGPVLDTGRRTLLTDGPAAADEADWLGTLARDDTYGWRVTDVSVADAPGDAACGVDPFELEALVDGRCGRDVEGARVRVRGVLR